MSDSLFPVSGIADVALSGSLTGAPRKAGPAQAVRDFESLFLETLLQHSGIAQALETDAGPEGGMSGELMIRELARNLADQLKLGFGKSLGVEGAQ
jgi:hypothetical protein